MAEMHAPPHSSLVGPQGSVRFHTINRTTGRARIWEVGLTFSSQITINAFDEGSPAYRNPLSNASGLRPRHVTKPF